MEIKTTEGHVSFDYKHDLAEEEGNPHYLPLGANAVIELKFIQSNDRGLGRPLMERFIQHIKSLNVDMAFLDICPYYLMDDGIEEKMAFEKLHRFYSQFGFVSNEDSIYKRMWLVLNQDIVIAKNDLPT